MHYLTTCIYYNSMKMNYILVKMANCIDEILEFYSKSTDNNFKDFNREKWLYNSKYLMKLMKRLDKESDNYESIKNCIIFLMNLCFDIENPDHYHTKGKAIKELSEGEKEDYKILLKAECSTLLN